MLAWCSVVAMVKGNMIESSFYAGIFCEEEARPNIVNNIFSGGDTASPVQVPRGPGILSTFYLAKTPTPTYTINTARIK